VTSLPHPTVSDLLKNNVTLILWFAASQVTAKQLCQNSCVLLKKVTANSEPVLNISMASHTENNLRNLFVVGVTQ
jgi:hypothetical protein